MQPINGSWPCGCEKCRASSQALPINDSGTQIGLCAPSAEGLVIGPSGAVDKLYVSRADVQPVSASALPTSSAGRKAVPLARGVLDYFPAALVAVAALSKAGNDKHNPGQELHHARGKSTDHADCIMRHLMERGTVDPEDGILHDVKVAWRALAMLQEELEKQGAPLARGARK